MRGEGRGGGEGEGGRGEQRGRVNPKKLPPTPPPPPHQKNFGRPVEWALVQDHAWSTPCLRKLDEPVDVDGKPWAGDKGGK